MEQSLVSIKRRSFDFRLNRRTSTRARHWSGRLPDARPDGQRTKVRGRETKTRSVFIHWHRPSSAVCFVSTELVPSAEYCPPRHPPAARWLCRGLCGTWGLGECSHNIPFPSNSWSALPHLHPQMESSHIHRRLTGSHSRPSIRLEVTHPPDSEDTRDRNTFAR